MDSDRTPESETGEVAVGTAPDDYAAIDLEIRELGKWFLRNGAPRGDHDALEKAARLKSLVDGLTLDFLG